MDFFGRLDFCKREKLNPGPSVKLFREWFRGRGGEGIFLLFFKCSPLLSISVAWPAS